MSPDASSGGGGQPLVGAVDEPTDDGVDLCLPAGTAEDAVVTDPGLQVVVLALLRDPGAQLVGGEGLPGRTDVVLLALRADWTWAVVIVASPPAAGMRPTVSR